MVGYPYRSGLASIAAAAALATIIPNDRVLIPREKEPEPSPEEVSRQRKRYLQRQARKATRRSRGR